MKILINFIIISLIGIAFEAFEKWDLSFIWTSFQTEEGRTNIIVRAFIYFLLSVLTAKYEKQINKFLGIGK